MKRTTRRLALTLMGLVTGLAVSWTAQANVFGTGNNGVYAEQQRFESGTGKGNDSPSAGGPSYTPPPYRPATLPAETPVNQVPEPQTLGLVAVGLLAAWAVSRRRKD
jgi:PEP-CTERM motif